MVNFLAGLPWLSHSTSLLQLECAGEFVVSLQRLNLFEVLSSNMLHLTIGVEGSRTHWDTSYLLAHDWIQSVEGCCILKTRLCTSLTSSWSELKEGSRTQWDASYWPAHDWIQSVEGCCVLKTRFCTFLTGSWSESKEGLRLRRDTSYWLAIHSFSLIPQKCFP